MAVYGLGVTIPWGDNSYGRLGNGTTIDHRTPIKIMNGIKQLNAAVHEDDQVDFNGHTYQVFDQSTTWEDARQICEQKGGHLATITSEAEQNFLTKQLQSHSKYFYWIGGTDAEQEGVWKWITGEPWNYENWGSGQPDNHSDIDGNTENYLATERIKKKWNDLQNIGDSSGSSQLKNSGFICEWENTPSVVDTISNETILRAKLLTVDHSFDFYREWTSPVQIMAEHLDPMPAVTWYTVENLIDMYYQSAKKSNMSSNNIANVTSVEFYEYLLFKLLDSKELGYLSITEPFGLIEEASGERINGALLKKIVSSGFKAGSKIKDENLVDIKNMCISICGTDDIEDIGWLDTILVSGKSIDEFATEFVKLYSLTSVSDARAEAIRMIGENTQIPALRTAAANVYTSIRLAKKDGIDYCLSGGLEASLDNLTTWLLDKMVDKMCDINPTSHIWKAASDSTTFVMDTIFLTDDISTNTIYILGMANVERALLSAIDKAEQSFQKNMSVENAQQLVALADTFKREITVGCDLVIKQVDHCERGNLNWNGILDLLSMIQKEKFNIGATIKWIFGDKDSSYAKVRKDIISIKKSVELADFYAGSVSVLELLREVKSTTPSAWASGEVKKAVNYGILPEWMRNNYQNNLTRIEFCALLEYMIEGKTGKTALQLANELAQVQGGHFKAPFDDALYMEVNDIARLGIISGVGNNLFNPLGEITRQEAATMLYRTANVLGYDTSSNAISFSDVAAWATKGVSYVTTKGIMVGTSNGFDPGGKYTKEQAILTMVRFYENVF